MEDIEKRIKEILQDGKTNCLEKAGTLIKEPDFILKNKDSNTLYGSFGGLTNHELDYLIHRTKGVTLSEQREFYQEEKPIIEVYGIVKQKLTKWVFKPTVDGYKTNWEVIKENKIR